MPESLPPGTILSDRYTIEAELGHGGMATVYRASDGETQEQVAVKVLRGELAQAIGAQRFAREIHIASALEHPNVVSLIGSGADGDVVYCVMPLFEGKTLRDRLDREKQLSVEDALDIAEAVARALDYAHAQEPPIIHRDVKPENILLAGDRVGLADFGIAKALTDADPHGHIRTSTGIAVGTPRYMSPEQATADQVDHRTDVYALGCVLYEMLAGEPPFTGTQQVVIRKHALDPPPDLRTVRPGIPDPLWYAIERAMAKSPADRFKTAGEFVAAARRKAAPRPRPWRKMVVGGAVAVAALATAAIVVRDKLIDPPVTLVDSLVAVLPFSLQAPDDSDRWLTAAIPTGITPLLDGTAGLSAVSDRLIDQALGDQGRSREDRFSTKEASAIARQVGAAAYLMGNLVSGGGEQIVTAHLYDTRTGQERMEAVHIRIDTLPGVATAIDQIYRAMLTSIGEEPPDRGDDMSRDQEAFRAYVEGRMARRAGDFAGAAGYYRRAVAADSTFALAALAWTEVQIWLPDGSEHRSGEIQRRMREVMLANCDGLPPQDRVVSPCWDGEGVSDRPGRLGQLDRLEDVARQAPDRAYAQIQLGDFLFHHGLMLNVPDFRARAAQAFDSAMALESISWEARGHLDELRFEAGDTAFIRSYLERPDTIGGFDHLRWVGAWMLEDTARIAAYDEVIDSLPGEALQSMLRYANYLVAGFPQADRAAEVLAQRARVPEVVEAQMYSDLMAYQTVRGRPALVEELGMRRYSSRRYEVDAYLLANFFPGLGAWSALTDRADAIHASLDLYEANDWWPQFLAACNMALADAFEGRTARATAYRDTFALFQNSDIRNCHVVLDAALARADSAPVKLEAAARAFDPSPSRYRPYDTRMSLAIAAMYEALGQPERALEFVDRRPFFLIENRYRTPSLLMEGRISLAAGDTARAIRAYRQALAFLSDPEPAAEPIARETRETLAALVAQ